MTLLALSLLAPPAAAAPVDRGLQAQIHPAGFDFASDQLAGFSYGYGPVDIVSSWECYDIIEVFDLNLDVEIASVSLEPRSGALAVDVQLGTVYGYNMRPDRRERLVRPVPRLRRRPRVHLAAQRPPDGRDVGGRGGRRAAPVLRSAPGAVGQLRLDIAWFPDDIAWSFMEDTVLELAGEAIGEALPPLVADLTADGLLLGTFANIPVHLEVDDVSSSTTGLYAAADVGSRRRRVGRQREAVARAARRVPLRGGADPGARPGSHRGRLGRGVARSRVGDGHRAVRRAARQPGPGRGRVAAAEARRSAPRRHRRRGPDAGAARGRSAGRQRGRAAAQAGPPTSRA